ncbi:enoyl-CoA hydratase-related protein [Longimicrobium sp.]|uniref:enoyl-CoA hydratase-related protein n=1 Tax=Longimicrobium sp. TaxID=2029185 RepID=UPI002E323F5E|nr:enoyl-CoA hydratase-related protein [Longimicrobium sp.]HEX6038835.1 enoyl-CoA hydratase-related protein [Longimicrobium sp.]
MADHTNLTLDVQDRIATLSVNRPDKLNALNEQTVRELGQAMDEITGRDDLGGVIITGVGEKSFVAGADIAELSRMGPVDGVDVSRLGQRVFRQIELSRKPVLAAVNGFALGGGCELALACHLRIAGENAQFGLPEVKLGIIPGYGGTLRLPRIVGKGRALELMLTAQFIKADEAYRIGLVNKVVPKPQATEGGEAPSAKDALMAAARQMMGTILANGPIAVGLAIECATRGMEMSMDDGLALESNLFGLLAATQDMREGMAAFLEKRTAAFTGR